MNEQERLAAMYHAKLRGDQAEFDRLYDEEMAARRRASNTQRPGPGPRAPLRMRNMGNLIRGADGVYRPEAAR